MHEAGKGDKQRPTNHETYSNNYDLIFRKPKDVLPSTGNGQEADAGTQRDAEGDCSQTS